MAKKSKAEMRKSQFTGSTKNLTLDDAGLFYGLLETMDDYQKNFVESIFQNTITFCEAGSGTGKSTMSLAASYFLYELGIVNKIVYVFQPVMEQALGFRPGSTEEKTQDYLAPLHDALIALGIQPEKALHPETGFITAMPSTFMRGSNLQGAAIIVDEAQNFNRVELKKVLTRCHDNSKVIVIGSVKQIDMKRPQDSAFIPMIHLFLEYKNEIKVAFCELHKDYRGKISQIADKLPIQL